MIEIKNIATRRRERERCCFGKLQFSLRSMKRKSWQIVMRTNCTSNKNKNRPTEIDWYNYNRIVYCNVSIIDGSETLEVVGSSSAGHLKQNVIAPAKSQWTTALFVFRKDRSNDSCRVLVRWARASEQSDECTMARWEKWREAAELANERAQHAKSWNVRLMRMIMARKCAHNIVWWRTWNDDATKNWILKPNKNRENVG